VGHRITAVSHKLGLPLMPWQEQVALVAGEMIQDPESGVWVPAYPEVVVTVPRQNGKTILILSWEMDRLTVWESWDSKPQYATYTAQTGTDARQKLIQDHQPLVKRSPFHPLVEQYYRQADNTAIAFKSGARLQVLANSEDAGHGKTVDLAVMDEIYADEDMRREQAMIPAMATRHDRQKLMTSTAGTAKSRLLAVKQAAGRAAVDSDKRESIAYFEWSVDKDADPEDPKVWRECMPALGITIWERTVRQAYDEMLADPEMGISEFKRAWLNIPNSGVHERVIPDSAWKAVADLNATPQGDLVLAADAKPDHSAAAIAVADSSGRTELIDHNDGVGWVIDRLEQLSKAHNARIVVDKGGPLAHIADELAARRLPLVAFTLDDYKNACAALFTNVMDKRVRVRPDEKESLNRAVAAARKRKSGDRWIWTRSDTDSDVCPLVAVTLALGEAFKTDTKGEIGVMLV